MLEVIVPASNRKLTTLAAVKAALGIPEADTSQDAFLAPLIDQASDAIVTFCNRSFARETYRETLPGYGGLRLVLSRTPVVSVASITADGEVFADYLVEDAEAGILYRKSGWRWTSSSWWNITWHPVQEELKFVIEYTAGYVLPGDQGVRTLPEDVELACIETVRLWFLSRKQDINVPKDETGEPGFPRAAALPSGVRQLLAPWRRIV
jgi:hypothetical protein